MDRWAASYSGKASFLCVCCAGQGLAREFVSRLKLSTCAVGFADEGQMPEWGQLGCNGLIVLDKALRVASPATLPFLEVRALAFRHVECLLSELTAGRPAPRLVRLSGLRKRHDLNGELGVLVKAGTDGERSGVRLLRGGELSVLPENLERVVEETVDDDDEEVEPFGEDHSSDEDDEPAFKDDS